MSSRRSPVTYCARAKLLSLLDEKFGVFFKLPPYGSLEINFLHTIPEGEWLLVENYPRVYVDAFTFKKIEDESAIDFDFKTEEFIIKRTI